MCDMINNIIKDRTKIKLQSFPATMTPVMSVDDRIVLFVEAQSFWDRDILIYIIPNEDFFGEE